MLYRNATINDLNLMCDVWNDVVNIEKFFKPFTYNEYKDKYLSNEDFDFNGTFLAFDDKELVGFGIGILRKKYLDNIEIPGYINCVVVLPDYRNQGIGNEILTQIERYFKANNRKYSTGNFFLPSCFSWYIPDTNKHDHPCAPAIRVNSKEYFFLLHNHYHVKAFEDAFHLALKDYEFSPEINKILEDNVKEGIKIELYDPAKHSGFDEFYKAINIYDFEKVIKENLALDKPYPFLVINDNGKVKGWTGAMWNEESGRGHFDGIAISPELRGRGLGKALFSSLAYYSKNNGAKFMTFYTGLNNHARYIYMGAGFKIIQSFAVMRKDL